GQIRAAICRDRDGWAQPPLGRQPQREEEVDSVLEAAQVPASELFDPLEAITKCVDVHVHLIGASLPRPGTSQERIKGAYQVRVVSLVVVDQWTKQQA